MASPRDPTRRGSQVSFHFAEGYAAMQALIANGVIGDFRAPDLMRFGFAPLYNTEAEVRSRRGNARNRDPRTPLRKARVPDPPQGHLTPHKIATCFRAPPSLGHSACRGVAQPGSAFVWGTKGRRFKSGHSDHSPPTRKQRERLSARPAVGRAAPGASLGIAGGHAPDQARDQVRSAASGRCR